MADIEKDYLEQREQLAEARTSQAEARTDLSELRTEYARERNELAKNRTRLANKRTFLAWCRTALSFMTFGFLLEKINVFMMSKHATIPQVLMSELGLLGKFAFISGPILMAFAGWRYYKLEKEIGFSEGGLYLFPELVLFGVVLASVLIFVFF